MIFCELLHFIKADFPKLIIFRAPKIAKSAVLELLDSPKLISRKIMNFQHCALHSTQKVSRNSFVRNVNACLACKVEAKEDHISLSSGGHSTSNIGS